MVVVPWSVSCALQESSVSQNSKNSAITAHSTGEEEATKRFDFLKKRLLAAETSVILLAFQKRLTCCHQVLVSEDTLKVKPLQFCASLCHQNGEAVWQLLLQVMASSSQAAGNGCQHKWVPGCLEGLKGAL